MKLVISEKDNAASRIADILSGGTSSSKRVNGVNTYRFDDAVVIGLRGHIVNIDYPSEYDDWNGVEPRDLVHAPMEQVVTGTRIASALRGFSDADAVIVATDYDREGELIGVEALRLLEESGLNAGVYRARFSSLTEDDVKRAFDELEEIDYDLAAAGEARQKIDLMWGASLTREISLMARRYGENFLSVGRVQTPTLAMIVDKEHEREAFVPEPYWEVGAMLGADEEFETEHRGNRFWDHDEGLSAYEGLGETATVISVVKKRSRDRPPAPFNTTAFQRAASSIGYSPARAMRIASDLYTAGYISYPRTDNTVYPDGLNLRSTVEMFRGSHFDRYASALLERERMKPTRGKKQTTDHPPIYPVSVAEEQKLSSDEWKIYELVVRRFFATLADPAIREHVRSDFDSNGEPLKANGTRIVKKGWRWFYPYRSVKEVILPDLEEGAVLEVVSTEIEEKETQPPGRFGTGRLVTEMEKRNLGTKATRHGTISKLYSRGYIYGNPVKPTKTAESVIDTLEDYAPLVTTPDMTAELEEDMSRIAEGELVDSEVVEESREMLDEAFRDFEEREDEIQNSLREGLRSDREVGSCPDCGETLVIRRSRRGGRFVGCSGYPDCTYTLPLPRRGNLIVTKTICDEHGLHGVKVVPNSGRPWDLGCPICNYEQWKEVRERKEAEAAKHLEPGDTVSEIKGVGEKYSESLAEAGIETVSDLASYEEGHVEGLPRGKFRSFKRQAKKVLETGAQQA
ncbi:MAG: Reverse gyrase 1 [Methanonatronarchaeales archaeon]|nr:Reverse gyrase 1 [Methanonatronarchaeales archaeon]